MTGDRPDGARTRKGSSTHELRSTGSSPRSDWTAPTAAGR